MADFLKKLVFPAGDAGANETFQNRNTMNGDNNEASTLLKSEDDNNDANYGLQEDYFEEAIGAQQDRGGHEHGPQCSHSSSDLSNGNLKDNHVLKRLKIATCLCMTFMVIEVVGGLLAGSLAVLSDAAHLTADLASFAVAIVAAYLAARPSTSKHTYGLKRTESLAALFSMTCLAMISVGLAAEAVRRIYLMIWVPDSPENAEVDGKLMSMIATIGVLVNVVLAVVLGEHHVHMPGGHDHSHSHDHGSCGGHHVHNETSTTTSSPPLFGNNDEEAAPVPLHLNEIPQVTKAQQRNVNLHAAYLHVMADLAQSVAVLIAGLIIWWKPTWKIVDPIATILFCCLVFYSTLGVIRSAICVLLEEVPPDVSWRKLHDQLHGLPGVTQVHDLHIWSISHGVTAMSVHVQTTSTRVNSKQVLKTIAHLAKGNGIQHTTIQVQPFCNIDNGCITCGLNDEAHGCVVTGDCCREESYPVDYCRRASNIGDTSSSGTSSVSTPANNTNTTLNTVQECATGCCS